MTVAILEARGVGGGLQISEIRAERAFGRKHPKFPNAHPFTGHIVSLWSDDEQLGDTLASDPTGTTVWNSAMVLARLLESGAAGKVFQPVQLIVLTLSL